ncbi:MAG TPA: hypothetical protein VFT66_04255 [Roseiflexaceae bacterium]|jgi:DNA-binding NarL/FixJ family response regulator|nr:hypothetical protein [Roseiflexaceae bacterium]
MQPYSVLVIGSEACRQSIKHYAHRYAYTVVGELSEIHTLHLAARLAPDVIIVDSAADMVNPLVVLPALAALPNAPKLIVLSATRSSVERRLWLELGAAVVGQLAEPETFTHALGQMAQDHAPQLSDRQRQHPQHLTAFRHTNHMP